MTKHLSSSQAQGTSSQTSFSITTAGGRRDNRQETQTIEIPFTVEEGEDIAAGSAPVSSNESTANAGRYNQPAGVVAMTTALIGMAMAWVF